MLWLTGLLGAVAVGAVSFLDLSGSDEDSTEDEIGFDDFIDENGFGDLSPTLEALNSLPPDGTEAPPNVETAMNQAQALVAEDEMADFDQPQAHAADPMVAPVPAAMPPSNPAEDLASYDATQEELVLVWDDVDGADEPEVTLSANEDDPTLTDVWADEDLVAQVPTASGVSADTIALIPASAAESMGWTDS